MYTHKTSEFNKFCETYGLCFVKLLNINVCINIYDNVSFQQRRIYSAIKHNIMTEATDIQQNTLEQRKKVLKELYNDI